MATKMLIVGFEGAAVRMRELLGPDWVVSTSSKETLRGYGSVDHVVVACEPRRRWVDQVLCPFVKECGAKMFNL